MRVDNKEEWKRQCLNEATENVVLKIKIHKLKDRLNEMIDHLDGICIHEIDCSIGINSRHGCNCEVKELFYLRESIKEILDNK